MSGKDCRMNFFFLLWLLLLPPLYVFTQFKKMKQSNTPNDTQIKKKPSLDQPNLLMRQNITPVILAKTLRQTDLSVARAGKKFLTFLLVLLTRTIINLPIFLMKSTAMINIQKS